MATRLSNMDLILAAVITLLYTAVHGAPSMTQGTLPAARPVVVEVLANSSTNVPANQNTPLVLSASSNGSFPTTSSTTLLLPNTTLVPGNSTITKIHGTTGSPVPVSANSSTSARFSNSQNSFPSLMLPLGSEGPNAYRESPINAVVSNVGTTTTLDAAVSPPVITDAGRQPIINQNRRVEIRLIDFQMNRTGSTSQRGINQNFTIAVKFIAGSIPVLAADEDLAVVDNAATIFHGNNSDSIHPNTTIIHQSTSGFQQVFNGTYLTSNENKVPVQRIITAELCGQFTQIDRGYLEISIKPSPDISEEDKLLEGYYKCSTNFAYSPASQESDAFWTNVDHCSSGNLTNFSYRLWFKTRQYVIDSAACQNSRPVLDEHN
ncbi:hypothetical protein BV898_16023 [Hypsibius exemplaris]|uniref:ZP domain-containing protein n=1 Tax=Hypsibius exemplaris TaxID=2072580 RepID=A0A9X6RKV9_HYPEX|nr:hypothetical protein BV898_16023 [Hypsibius exemplaris]